MTVAEDRIEWVSAAYGIRFDEGVGYAVVTRRGEVVYTFAFRANALDWIGRKVARS